MRLVLFAACLLSLTSQDEGPGSPATAEEVQADPRGIPKDEGDLRRKLEHMVWYHGFETAEMAAATGLTEGQVEDAIERFGISPENRPERPHDSPPMVLPYPGGRHPRIGFLDGAINPRADTKVSIVSPWDPPSYLVVDLPEAIWWGDRLLFLAHTHIPTIWTEAGIELETEPWIAGAGGSLSNRRTLPNGVEIAAEVVPTRGAVLMELRLTNGSDEELTELRAQHCVLLRGAEGFDGQDDENTVIRTPYVARRSANGPRWVVTAWDACHRAWSNPPCPCLHSDPIFPDCPPGQSVQARGVIAFVEAETVEQAIRSVESIGWRTQGRFPKAGGP